MFLAKGLGGAVAFTVLLSQSKIWDVVVRYPIGYLPMESFPFFFTEDWNAFLFCTS